MSTDKPTAAERAAPGCTCELCADRHGDQADSVLEVAIASLRREVADLKVERDAALEEAHDAERELDIAAFGLGSMRAERDRLLAATATTEVALLRDELAAQYAHGLRMRSERDNALCVAMDLRSDREIYESVACGWAFEFGRSEEADLVEMVAAAIRFEREACAKIADAVERVCPGFGAQIARSIRARGGP